MMGFEFKLSEAQTQNYWNLPEAIELICKIEEIAPEFGCHVALTGGLLYKGGKDRKDADILFYRIRQIKDIDIPGLLKALSERLGIQFGRHYGWLYKAKYQGGVVDLFFPENYPDADARYPEYNRCRTEPLELR